jgi:uncharacterized protein YvpB
LYKRTVVAASVIGVGIIGSSLLVDSVEISASNAFVSASETEVTYVEAPKPFSAAAVIEALRSVTTDEASSRDATDETGEEKIVAETTSHMNHDAVRTVPFYSQFTDISAPEWRKVGCGIASLAMLIEYYEPNSVTVDGLLQEGIEADAFLSDAGWTHAGLIGLSRKYGLNGESHSLAGESMDEAFAVLTEELEEGPVMASVHYTFDPKNPIPHLVVINGVRDGKVYYNDPSESGGGGTVSIAKFQSSWKKRYIDIRPVS